MMAHQARNIRIVLNHKDAWFHTGIVAGRPEYCPDCNQIETFQSGAHWSNFRADTPVAAVDLKMCASGIVLRRATRPPTPKHAARLWISTGAQRWRRRPRPHW